MNAAVRRLVEAVPAEILQAIFRQLAPVFVSCSMQENESFRCSPTPHNVAQVCRRWRAVALKCRELWTTMDVRPIFARLPTPASTLRDDPDGRTSPAPFSSSPAHSQSQLFTAKEAEPHPPNQLARTNSAPLRALTNFSSMGSISSSGPPPNQGALKRTYSKEMTLGLEACRDLASRSDSPLAFLAVNLIQDLSELSNVSLTALGRFCGSAIAQVGLDRIGKLGVCAVSLTDHIRELLEADSIEQLHTLFVQGPVKLLPTLVRIGSLRVLALHGLAMDEHCVKAIPWSQLASYSEFACTWAVKEDMRAAYHGLDNVVELSLGSDGWALHDQGSLPHLRSFSGILLHKNADFLSHIDAPVLESLELVCRRSSVLHGVYEGLSMPALRFLQIQVVSICDETSIDLARLSKRFPSLEELSVWAPEWEGASNLVECLCSPLWGEQLQSLKFAIAELDEMTSAQLLAALQSFRLEGNLSALSLLQGAPEKATRRGDFYFKKGTRWVKDGLVQN
ncbi:unnamed protein product [Mycena citricolor]|uniref:F-box domain-containing protein n=1 Tax=Mycena citricolor TaxID=2018698 RepID=A0AAD2HP06_9AGAR|nr:unnamed protein product [Mycena citricolor]